MSNEVGSDVAVEPGRADFRGARALPLVLLPASGAFLAPVHLGAGVADRLGRLEAGLAAWRAALAVMDEPSCGPLHAESVDAAADLARHMAGHLHEVGALAADLSDAHDVYMGIRRCPLSGLQALAETTVVVLRAVEDLRFARIEVTELLAEIDGILELFRAVQGASGERPSPEPETPDPMVASNEQAERAGHRMTGLVIERWISAHHLYAAFYLVLADRIGDALAAYGLGDHAGAAAQLQRAAVLRRATTAAMVHASAMSMEVYLSQVRDTMQPPQAPMPLGGSMNRDNATARVAVNTLIRGMGQPYEDLLAESPALAEARDRFLAWDLLDSERHITVASGLIGDDRSLLQYDGEATNALGILRSMRYAMARRYAPLMRFGDPTVSGSQR